MNNFIPVFWIIFAVLLFIIVYCDIKYNMLRCASTNGEEAYSWGRVQLAWWTLIVLSVFIAIICCSAGSQIPTLDSSTVILLGITSGTTMAARLIDQSDQKNPAVTVMAQNAPKENFFLDILSDNNGVTVHRLQTVIFNFVYGAWFIAYVLRHYADPCAALHPAVADCAGQPWNYIIPVISTNNLILLGLSSVTYAALKSTENTQPSVTAAAPPKNDSQIQQPAAPTVAIAVVAQQADNT